MSAAWLCGLGLWAPGFSGVAAWAAGKRDENVKEPPAALFPARLGRRTSLLTRMAAEALEQAGRGLALAEIPTVYATAYGESQTLGALFDLAFTDGTSSPARFHNSVHNTAGGLLSIATANRTFSTTVSAGADTVAMALVECFGLLRQRGGQVIAVFADEAPPVPFAREGFAPAAAALALSAVPLAGAARIFLRRARAELPLARSAEFATNPIAISLPLVEALHLGRTGVLPLSYSESGWALEVAADGTAA